MKKRLSFLLIFLLAAGLLTLALRGWVSDYLLILLARVWHQAAYFGQVVWYSLDQVLLWQSFVMIAALLSLLALWHLRANRARAQETSERYPVGRVAVWRERLETLEKGAYFKWRFAQQLSDMLLAFAAYREGVPQEQARQWLREGRLDLPPRLEAYLRMAGTQNFDQYYSTVRQRPDDVLHLDPVEIVEYLEKEF